MTYNRKTASKSVDKCLSKNPIYVMKKCNFVKYNFTLYYVNEFKKKHFIHILYTYITLNNKGGEGYLT